MRYNALCFKLASIKLFNWLKENNLLFKVKYLSLIHIYSSIVNRGDIITQNLRGISDQLFRIMESEPEEFNGYFATGKMPEDLKMIGEGIEAEE